MARAQAARLSRSRGRALRPLRRRRARAAVPVVLANARLSARSAARYARAPSITRWALGNLAGIAAQTTEDAQRFVAIGAASPVVTGNVKFDLPLPDEMRERGRVFRA